MAPVRFPELHMPATSRSTAVAGLTLGIVAAGIGVTLAHEALPGDTVLRPAALAPITPSPLSAVGLQQIADTTPTAAAFVYRGTDRKSAHAALVANGFRNISWREVPDSEKSQTISFYLVDATKP